MILTKEAVVTLIPVSASSAGICYSYLLCMKQNEISYYLLKIIL